MSTIVTSIRLNLKPVGQEPDTLVYNCLMRPKQAAMHLAYNRLIEGKAEKTTWNILRRLFPLLTGRNLNDAIVLAKGTIESQQELLPEQIVKLDKRIDRVNRHHERELKRHREPHPERLKALQTALRELSNRRDELVAYFNLMDRIRSDRPKNASRTFLTKTVVNYPPSLRERWAWRRLLYFCRPG